MKMVMKQLSCKSFAKLNLCLHVIKRRDDGYHDIQGIFHVIDLYDTMIFRMNESKSVNLNTNDKSLMNEDNLIYKACRMLSEKYNLNIGVDITLEKKIPIGSGLGGGSSNAAVTLHAINKLYDTQLSKDELLTIADQLGSDVPFFIHGGTAYVSGKGNIVKKLSPNPKFYVLVFPGISISTEYIFGIISDKDFCKPDNQNGLLESEHNSFEEVVLNKYPELMQTKYWLSSFGKVRMSGTGSTLYIEFDSYESAIEANKEIGKRYRSKMVSSLESYDIFS
jgi:4-diphosphocytidyl-2-C-methyl-D-erythritol kinase